MDLDLLELYWAAGFYEGEGTIHCSGRGLTMAVSQKDQSCLERFQAAVGDRGKIYGPYTSTEVSHWQCAGRVASDIITLLWPMLSERRQDQAANALSRWGARPRRKLLQDVHGTYPGYGRGCRCVDCVEANRVYKREWARQKRVSQ